MLPWPMAAHVLSWSLNQVEESYQKPSIETVLGNQPHACHGVMQCETWGGKSNPRLAWPEAM